MKKYDMRTWQGRARRRNDYKQFNSSTLLPHTNNSSEIKYRRKVERDNRARRSAKWARILSNS